MGRSLRFDLDPHPPGVFPFDALQAEHHRVQYDAEYIPRAGIGGFLYLDGKVSVTDIMGHALFAVVKEP